jgi:hypothetical protein
VAQETHFFYPSNRRNKKLVYLQNPESQGLDLIPTLKGTGTPKYQRKASPEQELCFVLPLKITDVFSFLNPI